MRYRILSGPEGATIDPVTGLVQWDGRVDGAVFLSPTGASNNFGDIVTPVGAEGSLALSTLTVEGWFNPQEFTAFNGAASLFRLAGPGAPEAYHVRFAGNNQLELFLDQEDTGNQAVFRTPFEVELDRWYHVALVIDDASQTFDLRVDGQSLIAGELPTSLTYTEGSRLEFGSPSNFSGLIDNFRIWNVARTPEQLQDGLGQQFDGDPNLVLDYRFEDDGSRLVLDLSLIHI